MTDEPIKLPDEMKVPSEEEERPVRIFNGYVLANDIRHCRPRHLWPTGHEQIKEEWRDSIERYLAAFAEPVTTAAKEIVCPACGDQVTGHGQNTKDWRFRHKLTFSPEDTMEGRCANCGYPCRLKHEILSPNKELLVRLQGFPLFYHPAATQQTN